MQKRIYDMTPADKASFQLAFRRDLESRGRSWREIEEKIQDEIDATFDDEKFLKMSPDLMIDAAYARKEFKEKLELVDYLLWTLKCLVSRDAKTAKTASRFGKEKPCYSFQSLIRTTRLE